jgi:hypothetical protein
VAGTRAGAGRNPGTLPGRRAGGAAVDAAGRACDDAGMASNWMWLAVLAAAAGHALRWVPGDAAMRTVKIPATFALLYVVYAVVLARAGVAGMLVSLLIVEVLLRLFRRRRPQPPARGGGGVRRLPP